MGAPTWAWVSRRAEVRAIEMAQDHLDKIIEVAEASLDLFRKFASGSVEGTREAYARVHQAEKEADDIKRTMFRELSRGFIHPIDREELVRLLLTSDDIAAYLKAASRRATLIDPGEIADDVRNNVVNIIEKVSESTRLLKEAIEALVSNAGRALELADDIERLEEEVDEIRIEALAEVLRICDETRVSACIIAKEIVDSVENSEDKCEDAADVVRSIAALS